MYQVVHILLLAASLSAILFSILNARRRFSKLERANRRLGDLIESAMDRTETRVLGALSMQGDELRSQNERIKSLEKLFKSTQANQLGRISSMGLDLGGLVQHYLSRPALEMQSSGVASGGERSPRIVVSLTTVPHRLFEISGTIESLLQQTLKPDQIVLWLGRGRVDEQELPIELRRLTARGLSIRFCEDVGPHTKLIPSLREFGEDIIVTVDDDILYPPYLIEVLYLHFLRDPSKIYCTRARRITYYGPDVHYLKDWPNFYDAACGLDVFPLGVGGVLYPPACLHQDVFDLEWQRKLSPLADDVWFKTMSLRKNIQCERVSIRDADFPMRPFSQERSLHQVNVGERRNEQQIIACFEHFNLGQLFPATRPEQ